MRDYVELVKSLRLCAKGHCESGCMCFRAHLPFAGCTIDQDEDDLKLFAADAIEELLAKNNELWIQLHVEGRSLISEPPKEVQDG